MNLLRVSGILLGFAALAIGVVYLRTERTRSTARLLAHDAEWVRLRRELWSLQTRTARQKAPARIHGSIDQSLHTELLPPGIDEGLSAATAMTEAR